jgi:hypothetical protein
LRSLTPADFLFSRKCYWLTSIEHPGVWWVDTRPDNADEVKAFKQRAQNSWRHDYVWPQFLTHEDAFDCWVDSWTRKCETDTVGTIPADTPSRPTRGPTLRRALPADTPSRPTRQSVLWQLSENSTARPRHRHPRVRHDGARVACGGRGRIPRTWSEPAPTPPRPKVPQAHPRRACGINWRWKQTCMCEPGAHMQRGCSGLVQASRVTSA